MKLTALSTHEKIKARMKEEQATFVALMTANANPQDWPQDFHDENGCYECSCCYCGRVFLGYKRRVVCAICHRALNELL